MPSLKRPSTTLLLLCFLASSCAHSAATSANGWITVSNDASSQPTCNRAAARILVARRARDKRDAVLALSEAWEAEDACAVREGIANERANRAEAMKQWLPWIIIGSMLIGAGAGLGLGTRLGR